MAPFQMPRNVHPMPPMWNIGSGVRLTVSRSKCQSGEESTAADRLRCVVSTPFGTPVVPDVYICTTVSPASPLCPGSTASWAASHASYSEATAHHPQVLRHRRRELVRDRLVRGSGEQHAARPRPPR